MDESLKSNRVAEPPQPSEADVAQALVEIEKATKNASTQSDGLELSFGTGASWLSRNAPIITYVSLVVAVTVTLAWGVQLAVRALLAPAATRSKGSSGDARAIDPLRQAEIEGLLARVAAGDPAAADQILEQTENWTGQIHRSPRTDQLIATNLNLRDMHAREAAIQAALTLDSIPSNDAGLKMLEEAVGDPNRRAWALWMVGALGNRGVDPVHTAKIMESYLDDSVVGVRAAAVNGLALLATNETIHMLLDRFRNDPSTIVQERAACALAESGMYTHEQRMVAAATMVGWLNDTLLSPQQRIWAAQALHDISGQNFGADSAAWQRWYDSAR
jgi:HEAT repeat protein